MIPAQEWFEMADIIRKKLNTSVWVPLHVAEPVLSEGKSGHEGYKEEFFGLGSVMVPVHQKEAAEKLGWEDVGISRNQIGSYWDEKYTPSDSFEDDGVKGTRLVLVQSSGDDLPNEWHLHQDFVITLGLRQEGDVWICPQEGYIEVARIKRDSEGSAVRLEVRAEHLKDYLCARSVALYVNSYHMREAIVADPSFVKWSDTTANKNIDKIRWEGRTIPIHEGGDPYGEKMAVFHVHRTDADEGDDMPDLSEIPTDANTFSDSWVKPFEGKKLYRVLGDLWKSEWVEPSKFSPRIKNDEMPETVFFTIDEQGTKVGESALIDSGKWLWFKPEVMMPLSHRRGGSLKFYTKETGQVGCAPQSLVHFGVNNLGLINVCAKDIGLLPTWQQQIWAGYNVGPEGGISSELFSSQVKAKAAETQPPERFLKSGIEKLNELFQERWGIALFREHDSAKDILDNAHRFRAINDEGLFALAKDLARLTADSIDAAAIQVIAPSPDGKKLGSLKSLENLLSRKISNEMARSMTAALFGVYELRHADAHLPASDIEDSFKLVQVDRNLPPVLQGEKMIHSCVSSLWGIISVLQRWDELTDK